MAKRTQNKKTPFDGRKSSSEAESNSASMVDADLDNGGKAGGGDQATSSQKDAISPATDQYRPIEAAASAATQGSDARAKKATSPFPVILRIALFLAACVFAILGLIMLTKATSTQSASMSATNESIQGEPVRHALVLFSYDESDANVAYERKGVLDILGRSNISSDIFYLDARASASDPSLEQSVTSQIVGKAAVMGGYDVIITAGDEALSFVMDRQELFGGVPMSFFAVDDHELAAAAQANGIATGYQERGTATLSLKTAAGLLPHAQRAVVLVDGSSEAEGLLKQLDADGVEDNLERVVWDVSTMTRDELAEELSHLDTTSIVMLLAANRDSTGAVFTPSATAHFVDANTAAPVFSAMGGVGEGVIGGAFIDRETEGSDATRTAVELLNGSTAHEMALKTEKPSCMVFDATALEAHGISPDAVPASSTLINEPVLSLRVLRPMIQPVIFLLIAGVCIFLFGIIGYRRSVRSNRAIMESHRDLQHRLYHDLLTDLPNRYMLETFAADPSNESKMASVVQLDIEDFTDINDSYGHAVGNDVIKIVAQRLQNVESTLLARSGGDEFTLAFDHQLKPGCSELRHINRIFTDPVVNAGNKIDLVVRSGVANREPGMTSEDLIVFSDLAIQDAKSERVNKPVFYSQKMRTAMERKIEITAYLKKAIAEESIEVVWQPQVDTATLKVYGYEALCRLKGNVYYPSDFIPVAEMSGLVAPLDRIVTKKVIVQLGKWIKEGRKPGVTSINFSVAQLRDKGYCDFMAEQLAINNVPASLIKVEITESMVIGNEEAADALFKRLLSMGITLALDDFGTGYSSLYRMANSPVDFVKLDKSLVDTFAIPGKEGFIDQVTQLVHGLDKKIVVEGVETYEQYEICLRLGCDIIQGYFFSKPVSAKEAIEFDGSKVVAEAKSAAGDKTRNSEWHTYDRDAHGRWKKKESK